MTAPDTAEAMDLTATASEAAADDDGSEEAPLDPSGFDGGWWLTEPNAKKVREAVLEAWKRQTPVASKRDAKDKRGELLRAGVRGVQVVADEEEDRWAVRAPFSGLAAAKAPNRADQLIRRVAATLTVDPPAPEVTPNSDRDEERAAAEFAERVLRVEGSPAERDDAALLRQWIDLAGTAASPFVYGFLHPQHTLAPVEIQALPMAQTVDDALVVTQPGPDGQPIQVPADPAMLTTRYVRVNDTLTDTPAEARLGWQPRWVERLLKPSQVRVVPPIGWTSITDADGAMVGEVTTLGEVIARFYEGERPSEEVCRQLVAWKPDGVEARRWVPESLKDLLDQAPPKRPDGTLHDDALVTHLTLYLTSSPLAPLGARIVVGGAPEPLVREAWRATIGDGAQARVEYLPLPLAQLRWREDTATGDPYGVAGIDDLAALDEIRAALFRNMLDYVDRYGAPQAYLPMGTTLQPSNLASRSFQKPPLYVEDGKSVFYEPTPSLNAVVPQLYDGLGKELDTASGLEEAAQGVSSPSVKSGTHARQIIEQALVALAGLKQNADKAMCRVWSLRLTFMRAYYKAPRLLKQAGEGGDFQHRQWVGAELMGAGDVTIARGTGTMMPKSTKMALAREDLELAAKLGDQTAITRYYKAITGGTTPVLGLQDDPVRERVARQIASWKLVAKRQHAPAPAPMGMDPRMGQPMAAPDPVALEAAQIFAPNPTDDLPAVAPIRLQELTEAVASKAFAEADPRVQQPLVQEWARMKQAAGVMTLAEQQQMQAEQQQQQMQMAQQLQTERLQQMNADQAAKTAYAEKEGGPAAQRMAISDAVEQMRGQPEESYP